MTMIQCPLRVAGRVLFAVLVWVSVAAVLPAQSPPVHFQHAGIMPPGAIGNLQLQRGGPLPGYFQPVEIRAPQGVAISTSESGEFGDPEQAPRTLGLLIGSVYRLRVANIPNHPGHEVYPTIEVVDRLYPPVGMEFKFPILIELTQEELEMAIDGKFVTRVIYLEDPEAALPQAQGRHDQPVFEAADGENPLDVADSLGRPMAILRLGGRVPDANGPDERFLFGSPALLKWHPHAVPTVQAMPEGPLVRQGLPKVRPASATSGMPIPMRRGVTIR
jgi:hypothetical protein